ncbi:hypothetical protein B0H17DRAFT_1235975 [Mycena rosella]|uniref:F-box domain-containing protein n=1 Tax=Mycena rosella TaxID=1033263 RepID=A0AAD7G8J1_MYCRO|nr:hypothetical protein B0H17DRAFT_1235975 [Mycena rosella]
MVQQSPAMRFFELAMGPHDVLFSYISARELVRLMRTCRRVNWLVHDTCFNLIRLLISFFGDALEVARFQRMQARSATLISGSTALQFFNRLTYPGSDLDLYAHGPAAEFPVRFLLSNGYTFDPRKSQDADALAQLPASVRDKGPSYLGRGIADVLDFHKGSKKIQLIIAESTPMETILSFHPTPVMNVLTHDRGYALYPRATFETATALIIETVGAGQELGRQKYVDRGWPMTAAASVSRDSELGVRMVRWVGDAFTWTLPLRPDAPRDSVPDLTCINSWKIDCDTTTTRTHWAMLKHPELRYKYTIADVGAVEAIWDDVLYVLVLSV